MGSVLRGRTHSSAECWQEKFTFDLLLSVGTTKRNIMSGQMTIYFLLLETKLTYCSQICIVKVSKCVLILICYLKVNCTDSRSRFN